MMSKKKFLLLPLAFLLGLVCVLEIIGIVVSRTTSSRWKAAALGPGGPEKSAPSLKTENEVLRRKIQEFSPKGLYILMDSAENRLYLRKGEEVLLEAVVSCGSGSVLEEPGGKRKWVFDTPRGEFYVKSKIKEPDWIRPDWAFIEEGKEVPRNFNERVESGVLGNYALGFGDGYFIHGTLYTRLLGRNVTHGCIRVGDKDLEFVYKKVEIGTKVYIY